jgi:heptosyltransferase-1
MRVLLVKLTSMGDLIHALPAITDATKAIPGISFDWVIEKSFSEVARFHPSVKNIIPSSHRKWKKDLIISLRNGEIQQFIRRVRKEKYDIVIDGQTSLKSAFIMLLTRGLRCGLDRQSAREALASFAYQKKVFVDKNLHAIQRLRILFAEVLNYPYVDTPVDYGIAQKKFLPCHLIREKRYLVFVHNASWQSKLWPEAYWRQLCILAAIDGYHVVLPWGNEAEKLRALRISDNQPNVQVLPFCNLTQHAGILQHSHGAICSDTGLSHLAAAFGVPALTLYGSTSVKLIGTTGLKQQHLVTPFACKKCYKQNCHYNNQLHPDALCQLSMRPDMVWERFKKLLVMPSHTTLSGITST